MGVDQPRRFRMGCCVGRGGFGEVYQAEMASPNQCQSTKSSHSRPANIVYGAHGVSLIHIASDPSMTKTPIDAVTGCRDGFGTK